MLSRATFLAVTVAALLTACGGGGSSKDWVNTSSNPADHAVMWLDAADPADLQDAAAEFSCVYEVGPHGVYLYTNNPSATAARVTAVNELRTQALYVRSLGCHGPDVRPTRPVCSEPRAPECR